MSIPPAPIHEGHVEQAVLATLQTWIRTYLGFAETWYGYPAESLPDIAGWVITDRLNLARWPEEQIPCVIIHCDGREGVPRENGDGYGVDWNLRIGLVVSAADEASTQAMARVYASALTACLDFHGLTDLNGSVRWMGGDPYPPDEVKGRTLSGYEIDFLIDVPDVLRREDVPTVPLPDPPGGGRPDYPDAPTAETVTVTVAQKS